jgi:uncharacterized protein (DUF302 family)
MDMVKKIVLALIFTLSLNASEIIIKESKDSVAITMQNIKALIATKGLKIFAEIDHSENAYGANMQLPESKLIIFGNPKIGTSLMKQNMLVGLDIPMKILVFEDSDGKVKIAYRNGTWLVKEHNLGISQKESNINHAIDKITDKAGQCKKD